MEKERVMCMHDVENDNFMYFAIFQLDLDDFLITKPVRSCYNKKPRVLTHGSR